jgi:site-specific DNA-methyltransferase (adenine-specific)
MILFRLRNKSALKTRRRCFLEKGYNVLTITNEDNKNLMARYPDKFFDLAIVDPPYGSGDHNQRNHKASSPNRFGGRFDKYQHTKRKTIHATGGGRFSKYDASRVDRTSGTWAAKYGADINEWDIAPPSEYFEELFRVSRYQIIWGGNYFPLPPSRNFIIWRKLTISESFSMAMVEQAWTNLRGNAKYYECMPQDKERFHPTQKPVELYAWLLSRYAKKGWKILDTHMGSGSIAIACHNAGFDLTACEINKFYFDKAMERINKHIQQKELFDKKELFQERPLFEEDGAE